MCATIRGMATRTPPAPATMGARIRAHRKAQQRSLFDFTLAVREYLPPVSRVTDETIRRYEKDMIDEDRADPILIAAIAAALDLEVSEISPSAAASIPALRSLLEHFKTSFQPKPPARRAVPVAA